MKKILFCFVFMFCEVFTGCGSAQDKSSEFERFVYPSEFNIILSANQKVEQCRIPEEVLADMTVEELVWAVIDFPFLLEVTGTEWSAGLAWLAEKSDAFMCLADCDKPENIIIETLKNVWNPDDPDNDFQVRVYQTCRIFYHSQGEYFDFTKEQLAFLDKN